ncbi:FAD/NAD(P)-binding domain-containing protein [Coniochaeta sp. PMI_546]|nr:FAD/NAD(P)-binding domain-containing protein [Coniochaeta sp. PMI_546]
MSPSTNFKVIVVGGGPVGLTAAHALMRAGIDFVLLESRPDIVIDAGSNLVLQPMGLRLLSQLGLFDALCAVSSPMAEIQRLDHSGRDLGQSDIFVHLRDNHGFALRIISRHLLTKVLYDTLPQEVQDHMFSNKKVSQIANTADGVVVSCTDGSSFEGSMVIGADGAHSLVRRQMRNLALQANAAEANDEQPFLTTYRALWVRFPTQADLQPGNAIETHGKDCAIQVFAGEDTSVIGLYERIETGPTTERARYSAADEEALIDRWGHLPISPAGLTVRDAYTTREQAGMVNLEEGVVEHWSFGGRVVLVGDAAHKFTPSTGAGCNNGIADIAVLVSQLRLAVEAAEATAPSARQLGAAFDAYQTSRFAAVESGCSGASNATATATWGSHILKFVDRHVMASRTLQSFFMSRAAPSIAKAPVLDYLETKDQSGKVPWVQTVQLSSVAAR